VGVVRGRGWRRGLTGSTLLILTGDQGLGGRGCVCWGVVGVVVYRGEGGKWRWGVDKGQGMGVGDVTGGVYYGEVRRGGSPNSHSCPCSDLDWGTAVYRQRMEYCV
jgi:hypothetical protein